MNLLSVFAGGLIFIPLGIIIGAMIFFYQAYRGSRSGSKKQVNYKYTESKENVPIYKMNRFWAGVALVAIAVVIVIAMISDK